MYMEAPSRWGGWRRRKASSESAILIDADRTLRRANAWRKTEWFKGGVGKGWGLRPREGRWRIPPEPKWRRGGPVARATIQPHWIRLKSPTAKCDEQEEGYGLRLGKHMERGSVPLHAGWNSALLPAERWIWRC